MPAENCTVCTKKIEVMAFRGTGFCSVTCKKEAGLDVPADGTMMYVSRGEKLLVDMARAGDGNLAVVGQNGRKEVRPHS